MTSRPVFQTLNQPPWHGVVPVEFQWHSGMHFTRRQMSMDSLHDAFNIVRPDVPILEVSTYSRSTLGQALSALNLRMANGPYAGHTVEEIYQSSKVFDRGGPYRDLLSKELGAKVKGDSRLTTSGSLRGFDYDHELFRADGTTTFYDYVYLCALSGNTDLLNEAQEYRAFSDIAFNPKTMLATQSKSLAVGVSLSLWTDHLDSPRSILRVLESIAAAKDTTPRLFSDGEM